jgi:hypothetical protein
MAINATNSGGDKFPIIDAGTYAARCFSMVHIGTVPELYLGVEKQMNKVRITWELPTESVNINGEDKTRTISKEFTLSMNEKANLRKFLEGWRGKSFTEIEAESFDITNLLGKECLLSVIHKKSTDGTKTYANISSVSTLPKGMTCVPQINENYEFSYDNFSWDKFNALPDYMKDKMRKSQEFQAVEHPENTHMKGTPDNDAPAPDENDLPF